MRAVDPDVHVTLTKLDEKVEKVFAKRDTKAAYFIIILNSKWHSKYEHGY